MKLISESISEPFVTNRPEKWAYGLKPNTCPNSSDRKKRHFGQTVTRRTMTRVYTNGKSISYIDLVKCEFCDFVWNQEWMNA